MPEPAIDSTPPAVTVIIATYNRAATLACAIESVLWQTCADLEAWIVGDACTDGSEEVVRSFQDPRLHWHNLLQNTGYQSEPHNEGLRRARGRYIAYLNHDDLWLPHHLALLVEAIERHQADAAYGIAEWVFADGEHHIDFPEPPHSARPPEASAMVHRRDWIADVGYWKPPRAIRALPRADYFRRGQFAGKILVPVPMLTVLKFGVTTPGYSSVGQQPEYLDRLRRERDFVETELARLLVRALHDRDRLTTPRRFAAQIAESARRHLIKRGIDPARLMIFRPRGHQIREWRRAHGLDRRD